ncbi:MAG: hypothetical protein K9G60_15375 [Pseudolabrys sp.]|nr:hypothetical protein [Pseudolabrys sp.]
MASKSTGFGVLALAAVSAVALTATVAGVTPASAEFFGCKEPRTTVSYSSRPYSPAPRAHAGRYTDEFAAQRSRHVTYSPRRSYRNTRSDGWR